MRLERLDHRRGAVARAAPALPVEVDRHPLLVPRHREVRPVLPAGGQRRLADGELVVVVALVGAEAVAPPPEPELPRANARALRGLVREEDAPDLAPVRAPAAIRPLPLVPERDRAALGHEVARRGVFEDALRLRGEAHGLPVPSLGVLQPLRAARRLRTLRVLRLRAAVERRVEEKLGRDALLLRPGGQLPLQSVPCAVERKRARRLRDVPAQMQALHRLRDLRRLRIGLAVALRLEGAAPVVVEARPVPLEVGEPLRAARAAQLRHERAVAPPVGLRVEVRTREDELAHARLERRARVDDEVVDGLRDDEVAAEGAAFRVEDEKRAARRVDDAHGIAPCHSLRLTPRAARKRHDVRRCGPRRRHERQRDLE